jgi:hypothetical protein
MKRPSIFLMRAHAIFDAMPNTISGIAEKTGMNKTNVQVCLWRIRKEPQGRDGQRLLPFTVAPAVRGPHEATYHAVLFEKDGSYYSDPNSRQDIGYGSIHSMKAIASLAKNLSNAITAFIVSARPSSSKRTFEALALRGKNFAEEAKQAAEHALADFAELR